MEISFFSAHYSNSQCDTQSVVNDTTQMEDQGHWNVVARSVIACTYIYVRLTVDKYCPGSMMISSWQWSCKNMKECQCIGLRRFFVFVVTYSFFRLPDAYLHAKIVNSLVYSMVGEY